LEQNNPISFELFFKIRLFLIVLLYFELAYINNTRGFHYANPHMHTLYLNKSTPSIMFPLRLILLISPKVFFWLF
jgi:hypothetical protein